MTLFIGVREPSTEPGIDTVVRYRQIAAPLAAALLLALDVPEFPLPLTDDTVLVLERSVFPVGELARE